MLVTRVIVPSSRKTVREPLAVKLRRNWLAKKSASPTEKKMEVDDSLTNLDWLMDLNMTRVMSGVKQPSTPSPQFSSNAQVNPNSILDVGADPVVAQYQPRPVIEVAHPPAIRDFSTEARKPPYSYAKLISCAIKNSEGEKSTLSGIYSWITDNFMYYRVSDTTWHNSIRHNLSLNKSFMKVPRRKDEPGKGGFWALNPDHADQNIADVLFKKRNYSQDPEVIQSPNPKRIKLEKIDTVYESPRDMFNAMTTTVTPPTTPTFDETHDAVSAIEFSDDSSISYDTYAKSEDSTKFHTISNGWNAILHQDIEVGGVKIKTERLLDEADSAARAITSYSPPPSEHSSSHLFNDLLKEFDPNMDGPLTSDVPLDMTVPRSTKAEVTNWWETMADPYSPGSERPMSTPPHSSSETEQSQLSWTDEAVNDHGYFDNIFDLSESFSSHAVNVL